MSKEARLVCMLARDVDVSFTMRNRALPALQALQDNRVVVALMKMSMFSLGIRNMAGKEEFAKKALNDLVGVAHVPVGLLGLAMLYGMKAAPRDANGYAPVEDLLAHVARIEQSSGAIDIDRDVANAITARAVQLTQEGRTPVPDQTSAEGNRS